MSSGKVLVWEDAAESAKLSNPADGFFTNVPCSLPECHHSLHCPGHSFLKDGSLVVPGGLGTAQTRIFRLTGPGGWEVVDSMAHSRFYPTCTTLPNGRVLAVAGPANGNIAPPGYYMLFVVSDSGVPSVAAWVRVADSLV